MTQLNSHKANTSHSHTKSQISDFSHTHDNRYFTESEINSKLGLYTLKKSTHSGGKGFNNYLTQGQYMIADDAGVTGGNPYNGTCWGILFVHVSAGDTYNGKNNWIFQEFWSTDSKIYRRQKVNTDAWTSWKIY